MDLVPTIGKQYPFYDDGKLSRLYMAEVIDIITPEQAREVIFNDQSLYTIWKDEIDEHRQTDNFVVHNGSDTAPGSPWLYAEETDVFVKCRIPDYVDCDVWFVRDTKGGWFSLDTESYWMSGSLVVSDDLIGY